MAGTKNPNRLENESAHSVSFKYCTILSHHIRIYHTYMNSINMSRGYVYEKRIFPIVLKEIQGGARSAPSCILYTLYMYCRMTVMQSRIDRFFFLQWCFWVWYICLASDICKKIDEKLLSKIIPAYRIHGYFGPPFFSLSYSCKLFRPVLNSTRHR